MSFVIGFCFAIITYYITRLDRTPSGLETWTGTQSDKPWMGLPRAEAAAASQPSSPKRAQAPERLPATGLKVQDILQISWYDESSAQEVYREYGGNLESSF